MLGGTMTTPAPSYDLAQAQYSFYKSATRLANVWYALTIIGLILIVLSVIISCVGAILGAGTFITLLNSIIQNLPTN
jgi:membrane-bound ClpP family serine protease